MLNLIYILIELKHYKFNPFYLSVQVFIANFYIPDFQYYFRLNKLHLS